VLWLEIQTLNSGGLYWGLLLVSILERFSGKTKYVIIKYKE